MFVILIKTIFLINLLPIVFSSPLNKRQSNRNDLCGGIRGVLCVLNDLNLAAEAAKTIEHIANETETYILNDIGITDALNFYVDRVIDSIHLHLRTPQYHVQFMELNNINKTYLVNLLLEANDAMSFYYNLIEEILNMKETFASEKIDPWFRKIKDTLRNEIICPYQSILDVYSSEWSPINQINRIEFSRHTYGQSPSTVHGIYSVAITKSLRQWMQRLPSVAINIKVKFI